jgi:hypothetical protein
MSGGARVVVIGLSGAEDLCRLLWVPEAQPIGTLAPAALNAERQAGLPPVHFGLASDLPADQNDADLVVVDAGTSLSDALAVATPNTLYVGLADDSRDGFLRLARWWQDNADRIAGTRWALLFNRLSSPPVADLDEAERISAGFGATIVGRTPERREIKLATSTGCFTDHEDLASVIDKVLELVAGATAPAR